MTQKFTGIVRKQLELVLGETKDDVRRVCYCVSTDYTSLVKYLAEDAALFIYLQP